ncbi:MAG: hypothetical protein ACRDUA_06950 [Micromonosporaceae bacterium]
MSALHVRGRVPGVQADVVRGGVQQQRHVLSGEARPAKGAPYGAYRQIDTRFVGHRD